MRCAALLVILSIRAATAADDASIRLAATPERENVTLLLGAPPAALVQEARQVQLSAGAATLVLSWAGTKLVADSLELSLGDEAVQVGGPVLLADPAQHARWTLTSPRDTRADLVFRYLIGGLTWQSEYTVVLDEDAGTLSLDAVAAVTNASGEDFENAQIDLGLSAPVPADLENGATLRLPYVSATGVSYELVHIFDVAAGADTLVRLELENALEAGLGAAPLPAGKMRLYADHDGQRLLTGEVRLPHTPVGARAEVVLGTAREVSVERRVIRIRDVDVKKDVHGRMALYNREEEIALLIESQKDEDVLLKIVEKIDDEWKMLSNSHEFEQKDANHIEFVVPVAAHSEVTVRYKVRRINLLP